MIMSVKALVFLVTVLAATNASAASSDTVMWLWNHAWPRAQLKHQAPPPDVVVVAPEVEPTPLPLPRPKVEAKPSKPEKAVARKPRIAVSQQRKPTADECAKMRKYGRTVAKTLSSYSDDQIERAFRDCGL